MSSHLGEDAPTSGLLGLAVVSLLAGAAAGLVGALFRLTLEWAERLRAVLLVRAPAGIWGVLIVIVGCGAVTALAAWLVRRFSPHASGSGIPHVEAVLRGLLPQAPYRLIPIKFIGGTLAIGAGLALGREGPTVQMGASVANLVGSRLGRSAEDCRALLAAGAGAGLATAFNAPVAGAVFVLEELVRRFDTRITVATLGASAGAIAIARVLTGSAPDFHVEPFADPGPGVVPIYLTLGIVAGVLGLAYNRAVVGAFAAVGRLRGCPVELRAGVIGGVVGLLAATAPESVGGGDVLTQRTLAGQDVGAALLLVWVIRFGLGAISYASRTPGGLFAPMLVLGCQSGVLLGHFGQAWLGPVAPHPVALGVVGMAAFFTAVVRAPVTGMILVTELTGSFTLWLPLLAASFAAMLVPTLLQNPPIYDSLREQPER